jgi:hypothetical protein
MSGKEENPAEAQEYPLAEASIWPSPSFHATPVLHPPFKAARPTQGWPAPRGTRNLPHTVGCPVWGLGIRSRLQKRHVAL